MNQTPAARLRFPARSPILLLTIGAYLALFAAPLASLARTWWTDPEASHGLLLAPIALFLAWRNRSCESTRTSDLGPRTSIAFALLAAAIVMRYASALAAEAFVGRASILVAAAGLVIWFRGLHQLLALWLPFTLLALSVPLPDIILGALALPLQFKASQLGAAMLAWRDIPVQLDGNVIRLPGHELFVTEACSGLRSLTALLSLGVLLGGVALRHWTSRAAILALVIPVAVVINGVRVFLTGFLVLFVDPSLGRGFSHLAEGWLLFVVAFAALGTLTWAAMKVEKRLLAPRPEEPVGQADKAVGPSHPPDRNDHVAWDASARRPRFGNLGPLIAALAGIALVSSTARQRPIPLAEPIASIPVVLAGQRGTDRSVSTDEQRVAGMSDFVFRVFADDTTNAFSLYVGYYESQTTGKTIHSPRNCLPGAGWQTLGSSVATIPLDGRDAEVNRYLLANDSQQALVYYWYQGRGRVEASEYRVKWDLLRDAALRGRSEEALVRIIVPVTLTRGASGSDLEAQTRRADDLATEVAKSLIPEVDRILPRWKKEA